MNIWTSTFLGNTVLQWVLAVGFGLLVFLLLSLLTWLARWQSGKHIRQPSADLWVLIQGLAKHSSLLLFVWLGIFTALHFLNINGSVITIIETITIILVLVQLGSWAVVLVEYWLTRRQVSKEGQVATKPAPVGAVLVLAKIVVWLLVVILVLENIPGIHITALITSLGIGGIAIGLALQKVLGDLFASLTISIDQPFVEGDAISVDQFSGEVEHIGLKSTRLRSATGEQLIFSNSDLLESRIRNYKRMNHRLVTFTLNISFQTSHKKLQKIPKLVKDIIEAQPQVTFNRAHLKTIDVSALVFEVAYTINSSDFSLYMDTQQNVNLSILRQLAEEEILLAYPTQSVVIEK